MTDNPEKPENGSTCGSDGGCCCSGPKMWIWLVLVGAIVGVMIARNSGKKDASQDASVPDVAPVAVVATVGAPEVPTPVAMAAGEDVPEVSAPVLPVTGLPRMVDLGADKCIPCKAMAPILEDLKTSCAGILEVQFIDVWKSPDEAEKYEINLIPTQIFYDAAGTELFRHEGFFGKEEIVAKWLELGVDLTPKAQ